jgi:hypothetical protein
MIGVGESVENLRDLWVEKEMALLQPFNAAFLVNAGGRVANRNGRTRWSEECNSFLGHRFRHQLSRRRITRLGDISSQQRSPP